jgi:hypothetical protein
VYRSIVARYRLGKNVTAATDTPNDRKIVGHVIFYAPHVVTSKVGDWFFPELLVIIIIIIIIIITVGRGVSNSN